MSSFFSLPVLLVAALAIFPAWRTYRAGHPLSYMLPNFYLFTPYKSEVLRLWQKYCQPDLAIKYEPSHIPVIEAKDYSYESLKRATDNWRHPAIVRGLFKGTIAYEKWHTVEHLPARIGDLIIPVIHGAKVGHPQNNRTKELFGEAFTEIVTNPESKDYLFFPSQSRGPQTEAEEAMRVRTVEAIDQLAKDELDLDRLWKGFGSKAHKTFHSAQLIVGSGDKDMNETSGTGWHCAFGNNWFVQVHGGKRWYFIDHEHSAYLHPLRGADAVIITGLNRTTAEMFQEHIPVRYADVLAGDMLYNPDFEWHKIMNHGGLSIAVPVREVNASLAFQNNFQFASIVAVNKLFRKFGIDIGGYTLQY